LRGSTPPINVFVASTPLQLISCVEARYHYRLEEPCLLVVARPDNAATERQMNCLIDQLGWPSADIVHLRKKAFYFKLGFVFRRLSKRRISRLFVGNKASWIQEIFYLGLPWDQLVFVDDGVATVKYYHALHGDGLRSRISDHKRLLLGSMGISLRRPVPRNVTFFSCFALPSSTRVKVDTHSFPVFRARFPDTAAVDGEMTVGFLGQPFNNEGYLERLRLQLQQVIDRHPGRRLVYFMHRKENRQRLANALKSLPVEITLADMPIEVAVARADTRFCAFYSFISTALFTLKTIFPKLQVVQINDPDMAARVPYYGEIVTLFRQAGVETMELELAPAPTARHTC